VNISLVVSAVYTTEHDRATVRRIAEVRFEVSMAVKLVNVVFWAVMPW
jgi:hypothetical protein